MKFFKTQNEPEKELEEELQKTFQILDKRDSSPRTSIILHPALLIKALIKRLIMQATQARTYN